LDLLICTLFRKHRYPMQVSWTPSIHLCKEPNLASQIHKLLTNITSNIIRFHIKALQCLVASIALKHVQLPSSFTNFCKKYFNKRQRNKHSTLNPFCKYIIAENLNTSAMHYFVLLIAEEYDELLTYHFLLRSLFLTAR
jgi:hypothetical protein